MIVFDDRMFPVFPIPIPSGIHEVPEPLVGDLVATDVEVAEIADRSFSGLHPDHVWRGPPLCIQGALQMVGTDQVVFAAHFPARSRGERWPSTVAPCRA